MGDANVQTSAELDVMVMMRASPWRVGQLIATPICRNAGPAFFKRPDNARGLPGQVFAERLPHLFAGFAEFGLRTRLRFRVEHRCVELAFSVMKRPLHKSYKRFQQIRRRSFPPAAPGHEGAES